MRNPKYLASVMSGAIRTPARLVHPSATSTSPPVWFCTSQAFSSSGSTSAAEAARKVEKLENIEQIRRQFTAYSGGGFELMKDAQSGIALLCIRNWQKKNCFTGSMMAQFTEVLDEVERWTEGKALVLYGEHAFFSSGGDLDTVRQIITADGGTKMITLMQHNLARLEALPLITVAYIEGMSLGGGAELMTACDYRIARQNAVIGFVQVRVGITTVWGGGARLVQLIGYNKALNLLATGRTISGEEAAQLGFVDHLLPALPKLTSPYQHEEHRQEVLQNAKQYLAPFLALPRETMLVGKQVAGGGRENLEEIMERELEYGLAVWGGPVHKRILAGKVNHTATARGEK